MSRTFCFISPATNMLEGWYIIHFNDGIHSFLWSTKTFLNDTRKARYKQIKTGYKILKIRDIGQSCVLKADAQYCFAYIVAPLCCTEMGLNMKHARGCHH